MVEPILKTEEQAVLALRALYRRYGYTPYKMSQFESYDLYVRNKDFLVSDKIITFSGDSGRLLALKPDVTLSIVKNAPEGPGEIQKVYYNENVYRDYREILQTGLECVGDAGSYEIAEVVTLAVRSLEALGGNFVLNISHMGLMAAALEASGLSAEEKRRAADCLRQKSSHELFSLCRGNPAAWERLGALISSRGSGDDVLPALGKVLTSPREQEALEELQELWGLLKDCGCESHVCLDFSVANSLRYYSGVVFRGYLEGIPERILSGGQYDSLARKMGRQCRAIGFAVYLDLLQERQSQEASLDVDTLILHDGTVDVSVLTAAAQEAAKEGSVLVSRTIPKDRGFRRLVEFKDGRRKP